MPIVYRRGLVSDLVTDLKRTSTVTTAGVLSGCKVALYTNDIALNPDLELSDFDLATFDGYATSAAVTFGTTYNSGETNLPILTGDKKSFLATGSSVSETIFGYLLVNSGVTDWLVAESVESESVTEAGDGLEIVPRVSLDTNVEVPGGAKTST